VNQIYFVIKKCPNYCIYYLFNKLFLWESNHERTCKREKKEIGEIRKFTFNPDLAILYTRHSNNFIY